MPAGRRARHGLRLMRLMWMSCCCWHAVDATDANIAAHRRPSAKSSRTPRRGVQPGARGGRLRHGIRDSAAAFGWALPARRPPDPPRKDFARQPGRGALASLGSRPFPQSPFMPQSPVPVLPPPPPPPPLPSPSISPPNPLIVSLLPPSSSLSPVVRRINGQRHWHSAFQQLPPRFLMTR